jgi:hypothetical protein
LNSPFLNTAIGEFGLINIGSMGLNTEKNMLFLYNYPKVGGRYFNRGNWALLASVEEIETVLSYYEDQGVVLDMVEGLYRSKKQQSATMEYQVLLNNDLVMIHSSNFRPDFGNETYTSADSLLIDFITARSDLAMFSKEGGDDYYKFLPKELGEFYNHIKQQLEGKISLATFDFDKEKLNVKLTSNLDSEGGWIYPKNYCLYWPEKKGVTVGINLKNEQSFSILSEMSGYKINAADLFFAKEYLSGKTLVYFDSLDMKTRKYFFELKSTPSKLIREAVRSKGYEVEDEFITFGDVNITKNLPLELTQNDIAFDFRIGEESARGLRSYGLKGMEWKGNVKESTITIITPENTNVLSMLIPTAMTFLTSEVN